MKPFRMMAVAGLLAVGLLAGCGQKIDENKTAAEIQAEAAGLDAAAIQERIDAYQKVIAARTAELEKVTDKIKKIPLAEVAGEESRKLLAQAEAIRQSLAKLGEGLTAYGDALKTKQ